MTHHNYGSFRFSAPYYLLIRSSTVGQLDIFPSLRYEQHSHQPCSNFLIHICKTVWTPHLDVHHCPTQPLSSNEFFSLLQNFFLWNFLITRQCEGCEVVLQWGLISFVLITSEVKHLFLHWWPFSFSLLWNASSYLRLFLYWVADLFIIDFVFFVYLEDHSLESQ